MLILTIYLNNKDSINKKNNTKNPNLDQVFFIQRKTKIKFILKEKTILTGKWLEDKLKPFTHEIFIFRNLFLFL